MAAAVAAQRLLAAQTWPGGESVRVRMGLHTGEPTPVDGDSVGLDVHRAARIASAGHGGQVLLSQATRTVVEPPAGVTVMDLGEHRLKDFEGPARIHQVVVPELPADFPPLHTLGLRWRVPTPPGSFVGREDDIAAVVAAWTGIPAGRLMEGETAKLLRMEESLSARVVGQ